MSVQQIQTYTPPPSQSTAGGCAKTVSLDISEHQEALRPFREIVTSLANPFVVADVISGLQAVLSGVIDHSDGILPFFTHLNLPEDVIQSLMPLNTHIQSFVDCEDVSEITKKTKFVISELETFVGTISQQNYRRLKEIPECFQVLLSIKEVKKLPNAFILTLEQSFTHKTAEELEGLILSQLKSCVEEGENAETVLSGKIDSIIKTGALFSPEDAEMEVEWDLYTLLSEIIEHQPEKSNGLRSYWHKPAEFFTDKSVTVNDSNDLVTKLIKEGVRRGNCLTLHFYDQSKLEIKNCEEVTWIQTNFTPIWTVVKSDQTHTPSNSNITIDSDAQPPLVQPGKYVITYEHIPPRKRDLGLGLGEHIAISLTSINGQDEYKFRVEVEKTDTPHFNRQRVFEANSRLLSRGDELTPRRLDSILVVTEEKTSTDINGENIEQAITINEEENQSLVNLQHFKETENKFKELRNRLATNTATFELLNRLVANLVSNNLETIDLKVICDRPLKIELETLVLEYQHNLSIETSLPQLLKRITLEANYQRTIAVKEYLDVANTMKLLRDAMKNLKNIEEKPTSFFIGNTGAGKSTAVGFVLGATLEKFTNIVGEKVLRYKLKAGQDESNFPKIGQSLGESETLYTTGYAIQGFGMADCPGFDDTRGSDFELCANLSI
ncbi:hypothetical protein COB21_04205, partial [Candidatus Aerophobetes bacterium]